MRWRSGYHRGREGRFISVCFKLASGSQSTGGFDSQKHPKTPEWHLPALAVSGSLLPPGGGAVEGNLAASTAVKGETLFPSQE